MIILGDKCVTFIVFVVVKSSQLLMPWEFFSRFRVKPFMRTCSISISFKKSGNKLILMMLSSRVAKVLFSKPAALLKIIFPVDTPDQGKKDIFISPVNIKSLPVLCFMTAIISGLKLFGFIKKGRVKIMIVNRRVIAAMTDSIILIGLPTIYL